MIALSFTFYYFLACLVKWEPHHFATPENYYSVSWEVIRWQFSLTVMQLSSHCTQSMEIFLRAVSLRSLPQDKPVNDTLMQN